MNSGFQKYKAKSKISWNIKLNLEFASSSPRVVWWDAITYFNYSIFDAKVGRLNNVRVRGGATFQNYVPYYILLVINVILINSFAFRYYYNTITINVISMFQNYHYNLPYNLRQNHKGKKTYNNAPGQNTKSSCSVEVVLFQRSSFDKPLANEISTPGNNGCKCENSI